jgi:hypothetical protein
LKNVDKTHSKNLAIKSLTNGFYMLLNKNLHLIKDKCQITTIKDINQFETINDIKIAKTKNKIIYFKNDVNDIKEIPNDNSNSKNCMKQLFANKLLNDKNRLLQIIKKSLN